MLTSLHLYTELQIVNTHNNQTKNWPAIRKISNFLRYKLGKFIYVIDHGFLEILSTTVDIDI